jgi:AraC-like DNA-binding protein
VRPAAAPTSRPTAVEPVNEIIATDSISRIAARWGVHDMPHLVRAFRARYAMTPSEARRQSHSDGAGA